MHGAASHTSRHLPSVDVNLQTAQPECICPVQKHANSGAPLCCACRIVLAQLEGSGRGALASYNQEQYKALFSHLQEASLSDPHAWLEQLMRKDKALGEQ